jgi:hypothetical protein
MSQIYNALNENESGLMKYYRELLFEHEMDKDTTMPFKLWLCDKLKKRDDMLTMSANAYKHLEQRQEAELHEYGKELQGTILDLEWDLKHHKEKHEREVSLLESKIDELNEGLTEVRNDYQDICELTEQVCLPNDRGWLISQVGPENWERFKNHIGW